MHDDDVSARAAAFLERQTEIHQRMDRRVKAERALWALALGDGAADSRRALAALRELGHGNSEIAARRLLKAEQDPNTSPANRRRARAALAILRSR